MNLGGSKRWIVLMWTGMVVIALVAGLAAGVASKQKSFTVQQLRANWKAPYDLVVFPKGHALPTTRSLLNPNSLDSVGGGISVAQYRRIEHLPGVSVAAPLAPLGYLPLNFGYLNVLGGSTAHQPTGLYRITLQHVNQGLPAGTPQTLYADDTGGGGSTGGFGQLPMGPEVFVMATSPRAERQLMGLKQAVVRGHYFTTSNSRVVTSKLPENPGGSPGLRSPVVHLPILLTDSPPQGGVLSLTVTRLDVPTAMAATAPNLVAQFDRTGRAGVLKTLTGHAVVHKRIANGALWHDGLLALEGHAASRLDGMALSVSYQGTLDGFPFEHADHAKLSKVKSPSSSRWPVALKVAPQPAMKSVWGTLGEPFRTVAPGRRLNLALTPIGAYDPTKLRVTDDPLTHLPLVGYRPESGREVLNAQGRALNPQTPVLPDGSPAGLWTAPPEAITTLGAAKPLLSAAPISSIRIRVAGVKAIGSGGSRQLLHIAHNITRVTGLPVQIVRGASPEEVLIHPGALKGFGAPGWIETDWVRLGTSTEILREALLNQSVMLGPVLAAAAIFAGVTAWLGLAASRREWAVAAAVGVTPGRIWRRLVGATGLQGLVVALIAVVTALAVGGERAVPLGVPFGVAAGLLVGLAMMPGAWATAIQDPVRGFRPPSSHGVLSFPLARSSGLGLALAGAAWKRLMVSGAALVVPAATAYAVMLIQGVWHGTLHVTVLGQYLLLQGGWLMTLGLVLTLTLAGAAAAEMALANHELRRQTWAIGAAVGWRPSVSLTAHWVETGTVGALAGLVGTTASAVLLHAILGVPFVGWLWLSTVVGLVMVSLVAALPVVWLVARQDPSRTLRGENG